MKNRNSQTLVQEFVLNLAQKKHLQFARFVEFTILQIHLTTEGVQTALINGLGGSQYCTEGSEYVEYSFLDKKSSHENKIYKTT